MLPATIQKLTAFHSFASTLQIDLLSNVQRNNRDNKSERICFNKYAETRLFRADAVPVDEIEYGIYVKSTSHVCTKYSFCKLSFR